MDDSHLEYSRKIRLAMAMVLFAYLSSICSVQASKDEELELLRHYRPLAMDESVTVVKSPTSDLAQNKGVDKILDGAPPITSLDSDIMAEKLASGPAGGLDSGVFSEPEMSTFPDKVESNQREMPKLFDIEESRTKNISENLFLLPKTESLTLTKLITGKESPTMVHNEIIRPVMGKGKGKILATYRILVPIFIPAVKSTNRLAKISGPEVKFVKETHTEMVPVKKNVARVKTFYKAERVPQQIVTDYVRAEGNSVPSSVDDKLKPNEQVIKSIVTNYN